MAIGLDNPPIRWRKELPTSIPEGRRFQDQLMVWLIIMLMLGSFVVTFCVTWWMRGRGFDEFKELLGGKSKEPRR